MAKIHSTVKHINNYKKYLSHCKTIHALVKIVQPLLVLNKTIRLKLSQFGKVTLSVTWPQDSQHTVSYMWSIWTNSLPCTVLKIWCPKHFGGQHVDHLGSPDVIIYVTTGLTVYDFPYKWSNRIDRLSRLKDIGVMTLTFRGHVTSVIEQWMRNVTFPIDGRLKLSLYLAQSLRY